MKKEIIVKEVFKSASKDERDKYIKEKIVKLMLKRLQSDADKLPGLCAILCFTIHMLANSRTLL